MLSSLAISFSIFVPHFLPLNRPHGKCAFSIQLDSSFPQCSSLGSPWCLDKMNWPLSGKNKYLNKLYPFLRRIWLLWFCLLPLGATSLGFIKSAAITGGGPFTQYIVSHMQLAFGLAYALVPTLFFPSIIAG